MSTPVTSRKLFLLLLITSLFYSVSFGQNTDRIVLAYFPSWSETWTSSNQNSTLREVPDFVNYLFLAFAKPNLTYVADSYDLSQTGIEVPYDGCTLKESIAALKDKGIQVFLSVGGETYWGTSDAYNIDYQQIKALVDDMGFVGIDWDFEPNGSFANIGDAENVQHFIDFFNESRAIMPRSEGYLLACAPSGVGALGGVLNDDPNSPFQFANRNALTGEEDTYLYQGSATSNGINLFGYAATGHMIPVIQAVGDKIDLIAFQGYNVGGSTNRSLMYDAYAHYAEQYNFVLAAGTHYPDEPWGPFYQYTPQSVAELSKHITEHPDRSDELDGLMIWQLLMEGQGSSAYAYSYIAHLVFNGIDETMAVQQAQNFLLSPYEGGAQGCAGNNEVFCNVMAYNPTNAYPDPGTAVYSDCAIWENQWYANPNETPGINPVWLEVAECDEEEGCNLVAVQTINDADPVSIRPNPIKDYLYLHGGKQGQNYWIYNQNARLVSHGVLAIDGRIDVQNLMSGLHFIQFGKEKHFKFVKVK